MRGYHVWNIAVHLLCALVVFGVVRRTLELPRLRALRGLGPVSLAFAAALIWTLHPLNSEVVDYLTQRTESMMALCYLLTLYGSIRAIAPAAAGVAGASLVASCALGMACKETMVTAPVIVVLYDRVFVFDSLKQAFRARWRFYAGLAATWLVLAALIGSGPRAAVVGFSAGVSPWTYLLNQAVMIARYLRLAIWPRSLVVFYGWPLPLTLGDVMPYALLIVVLLLLTVVALVRRPKLGFLGAWFFITLAPTSSVVPIATEVGAERRMYLPLVALVVLAVIGGSQVWEIVKRRWPDLTALLPARVASLGGALVLTATSAALAAGTVARNREYASALSLARTVVERRPTSIAHHILGVELMAAGRHEEAVRHLREAIRGDSRARYDLGLELFNSGKLDEAIEQLQAFVGTWRLPYRLVPRWLEPPANEVIQARDLMGRAFAMQRRWPQAIEQARLILTMAPANVEAQGLLAQALFGQEMFEEAILHFREYLKARPNDLNALSNLGIALVATGKIDDAIAVFRHAVDVDPRNAQAHSNLATALYDRRDVDGAALHAQEAVRLKPDDPAARDLLGRAWAVQGRIDDARLQFERALQIDPAYGEAREDLKRLSQLRGSRQGHRLETSARWSSRSRPRRVISSDTPIPLALSLALGLAFVPAAPRGAELPSRLADHDFWQISTDSSEPNGYFRSDTLTSNELGFQRVIPELVGRTRPGGAYLGVGPEQNFTYIAALRPAVAIIFDIRRGNMLVQLMYKALFELAKDRADFVSMLFRSRGPAVSGPPRRPPSSSRRSRHLPRARRCTSRTSRPFRIA